MKRQLTSDEIQRLKQQGCTAENWENILVPEQFNTDYLKNVEFCGHISLGTFEGFVEIAPTIKRHTGIYNSQICNYEIGDNCLISNVGLLAHTADAQCQKVSICVKNEAGDPNLIAYNGLTSNVAALMVYAQKNNQNAFNALSDLVDKKVASDSELGKIGNNTVIRDTKEILNCQIGSYCEIVGAQQLAECSIEGRGEANIFVGYGVILENCVLVNGASVLNNALLSNCFVGEACTITNGFQAENSVFFSNSYMSNGEACAAFCGPFSASHHKSSLLIGVDLSFYNAGSNTNYSNHAYKMGPVHYGQLLRGSKTASGAHILLPANVGAFTMCMNKITTHPDTAELPFSYLFGDGSKTWLVPGRNLMTLGTYRDVNKWPKRDKRHGEYKHSIVNTQWLSPLTMTAVEQGIEVLERLQANGDWLIANGVEYCEYKGCCIKRSSIDKGVEAYRQALLLFLAMTDCRNSASHYDSDCYGEWADLGGLMMPKSELDSIVANLENGDINTHDALETALDEAAARYNDYTSQYALYLVDKYFDDVENLDELLAETKQQWIDAVRADAVKEYQLGDVDEAAHKDMLDSIHI